MSVSWGVIPSQPQISDFCDWLIEAGLKVPPSTGRYPTLEELRQVLSSLHVIPIQEEAYDDSSYSISIGEPYSEQYAHLLGSVQENQFHFHFCDSGCRPITMMEILKRLSFFCGPLVLYESYAATPIIIASATDLDEALNDWLKRIPGSGTPIRSFR